MAETWLSEGFDANLLLKTAQPSKIKKLKEKR